MSFPRRIQLKREAGFNLQEFSRALNGLEAVKVDRSTRWGNPFGVGQQYMPAARKDEQEVREVRECPGGGYIASLGVKGVEAPGIPLIRLEDGPLTIHKVLSLYRAHILETVGEQGIRAELAGKNLACWCALPADPSEPDLCHGAVLLEIANG